MNSLEESYQQLIAENHRLRSLIDVTTDAVFCYEYNPPIPISLPIDEQIEQLYKGVLVDCNLVCAKSYGARSVEEVIGHKLTDLFGTQPSSLDKLFGSLIDGGYRIIDGEGVEKLPDGKERYFLNNGHAVIEDGVLLRIWGTYRDVTERKQTEEDRDILADQLRTLLENSPDFLYFKDINRRFVRASKTFCDLFNCRLKDIIGKRDEDLFPQHVAVDTIADDLSVIETGQPLVNREEGGGELPWVMTTKLPWYDSNGQIKGLYGITRDITQKKLAEDALRRSEEQYRKLVEICPDMVSVTIDGKLEYVNPAFVKTYGGTDPSQFIGKKIEQFIHPDEHAQIRERIKKQMETGLPAPAKEVRLIRQDGSTFVGESVATPFSYKETTAIQAIIRDITDRKCAAIELQKLAKVIHHSKELVNMSTLDGNMTFLNEAGGKMLGIDPEECRSVNIMEVIPEHLVRLVERELLPALMSGETWEGDLQYRNLQTGCLTDVHAITFTVKNPESGEPWFLANVSLDITERKRIEDALKEANTILNRSPAVAFTWRNQEGWPVEFVTENVETIFGYTAEEFISGKVLYENCVYKEDFERVKNEVKSFSAEDGRTEFQHEPYRIVTKDGDKKYVSDWTFVSKDKEGNIAHFRGIIEDITDRILAEKEREKLQSQLTHAQKMESVGRLAGGVAHDFNNMLSVIQGNAELALGEVDPTNTIFDKLMEIQKATERSADLTRQLLAFARKQTVAPKVLDVNEIVEGMLMMMRRLIGEDIDLAWKPAKELWPILMDVSQIDQILANLCVNARDAIADVGKVTIETDNVVFDDEYCAEHPYYTPGEYVLLAVSDNGHGMDKETQANLFEPFFTTKALGEGTGLGLATVYGVVKQNMGFINVDSAPGTGTSFKIHLPRHVGKAQQLLKTTDIARSVGGGKETILLVEDEPAILNIATKMLEQQGYTILAAKTPGEAIHLAREHAGQIDLLMTDVVMPEMNGRDLAKNLLSLYPNIKRLFMSGYTANVIAHHGVLDKGVHFIQKPFHKNVLTEKVRELLDKA